VKENQNKSSLFPMTTKKLSPDEVYEKKKPSCAQCQICPPWLVQSSTERGTALQYVERGLV
jgi:hypothetical protein